MMMQKTNIYVRQAIKVGPKKWVFKYIKSMSTDLPAEKVVNIVEKGIKEEELVELRAE